MYQQRQLIEQLKKEQSNSDKFSYLTNAKDSLLVDFLCASHRRIQQEIIPRIEQDFMKLSTKIKDKHRFPILFSLFQRFYISLTHHMEAEEQNIFPILTNEYFQMSENIISHLKNFDHEEEEPYLTEIINAVERVNINNNPFIDILISKLKYFQNELKEHAWIEENILKERVFKKVIEKKLINA